MRPGWTQNSPENWHWRIGQFFTICVSRSWKNRRKFSAMYDTVHLGDFDTPVAAQLAAESHARRVLAEALVELGYGWDDGTDDESREQGDAGDPGNPDDDPIAAALRDKIAEMARGTDMIECEIAAKEAEVRRLRGLMGQEGPAARRPEDDPQ